MSDNLQALGKKSSDEHLKLSVTDEPERWPYEPAAGKRRCRPRRDDGARIGQGRSPAEATGRERGFRRDELSHQARRARAHFNQFACARQRNSPVLRQEGGPRRQLARWKDVHISNPSSHAYGNHNSSKSPSPPVKPSDLHSADRVRCRNRACNRP
jgi:hypothetical protein